MKLFQVQMRKSAIAAGQMILLLLMVGCTAHSPDKVAGDVGSNSAFAANTSQPPTQQEKEDAELTARLTAICERAGGTVGVAVTHVETNRTVVVEGARQLPLYSVFKLPLAVAVLKDVEENQLRLEQKVRVTPEEVVPGWEGNSALWRKPVERSVRELLEIAIVRSDNTSSDKLLQLVGGPAKVTERMRSLGFSGINIQFSVREFVAQREKRNAGSASDLAHLLARLQKGDVLQPPQLTLLLEFMSRATTGTRRLRGDLPPGTPVADKTGTGENGSSTNDVGIITLPVGKGHLAMAVLVSGSKLSAEEQEKLIAELARAAYDAHVSRTAPASR
ncbi:MAG: class A beta-lactamase [Acidobacteria bacterium]|nr:class A beta-lactamase [Acidobacteriota bacterium]